MPLWFAPDNGDFGFGSTGRNPAKKSRFGLTTLAGTATGSTTIGFGASFGPEATETPDEGESSTEGFENTDINRRSGIGDSASIWINQLNRRLNAYSNTHPLHGTRPVFSLCASPPLCRGLLLHLAKITAHVCFHPPTIA